MVLDIAGAGAGTGTGADTGAGGFGDSLTAGVTLPFDVPGISSAENLPVFLTTMLITTTLQSYKDKENYKNNTLQIAKCTAEGKAADDHKSANTLIGLVSP
jgi:hypothetical protein